MEADREEREGWGTIGRALEVLQSGHAAFHVMPEPDAESDTVLVTLNERDMLLIGMALPAMEILFMQSGIACFGEASYELQTRLMEVVSAQRPEWTKSGSEES